MEKIIFYHGKCFDGFGGAYAAWKKFGDSVQYVPLSRGEEPPVELARGKEVYFIDFCYPKDIMDQFLAVAGRMVVLDHHEGVEDAIVSMPEHVYATDRSGAVIAWNYFHPDEPVPLLLQYVQEGDFYYFDRLPDARNLLSYIYTTKHEFPLWDELRARLESDDERTKIIEKGAAYTEHFEILVERLSARAKRARFEGYECLIGFGSDFFASDVGHVLAERLPPIALVVNAQSGGGMRVSLRRAKGTDVDLAELAQRHGGNGHPYAAAFSVEWGAPIPWELIPDETSRN